MKNEEREDDGDEGEGGKEGGSTETRRQNQLFC